MNVKNVIMVREFLERGYEIFDALENAIGKINDGETSLRDVFKMDALKVVLYICATDGKLVPDEVEFVNAAFDLEKSGSTYVDIINQCDIYSTKFENSGLLTFDILKTVDQKIGTNSVSNVMTILEAIAMATALSDDNVNSDEATKLKAYFANLKRKYE